MDAEEMSDDEMARDLQMLPPGVKEVILFFSLNRLKYSFVLF